MSRSLVNALLVCCVFVTSSFLLCCNGVEAKPIGWKSIWGDEFNDDRLDQKKWEVVTSIKLHNNERQAYHPSRVALAGGKLVITADDQPFGDKAYTSGKVVSRWARQYGRWEVRAKLPGTRGTWPAIWLVPETKQHRWPSQGEIDIMENRGDRPKEVSSAFHFGSNPPYKHSYKMDVYTLASSSETEDFHDGFHVYAAEWETKEIRFFVDEILFWTLKDEDVNGFLRKQSAPMKTILNVAIGGDFVKDAQPNDSSRWPQKLEVDYVRVYSRQPAKNFQDNAYQQPVTEIP